MKTPEIATRELLEDAASRGIRYREGLSARGVFPRASALQRLEKLAGPLPGKPSDPREVLRLLDDIGSPATVATAGPRYFGFVTGGALPATLAANWLAGAWDQNAGLSIGSPVAVKIEEIASEWLCNIFGIPAGCGVGFVTGATMANFTAVAAARHALLKRAGWNVEDSGLF